MTAIDFTSNIRVDLVQHMGSDETIAQAARTSTQGLDQSRSVGLVRALLREGHWSPFESSAMTISLDVPLFVRDQIVRHKSLSFSVFSLRYSEASPRFWVPRPDRPLMPVGKRMDYRRGQAPDWLQRAVTGLITGASRAAWKTYELLNEHGIAAEVARVVLPTNLYTGMWVTGNLRSWLHFLDSRMDEHAQAEVREVAEQVAEIIKENWPTTFSAWESKREGAQ